MEIEEVKVVWIQVIPTIRDLIDVYELTDYVTKFFATSSIQKVKAQKTQSGGVIAADHFFEEAQRKPRSFPVILAALKKTNQPDVLVEILKTVVKKTKSERHEVIFELVRQAARDIQVDVEDEIREAPGLFSYNRHQHRLEGSNPEQNLTGQGNSTGTGRNSNVNQRSHSPQADSSLQVQPASPDSNISEIVPNTKPSVVPSQPQLIYQRRQPLGQSRDTANVELRKLRAVARTKISAKLKALGPDGETPVWSLLLDEEELDITAEESSEIENSKKSGKDFYDKLAQRNYTAGMLIEMLEKHNCHDAARTVREQSINIPTPSPSKNNENNLDLGLQVSPNDQGQLLNISPNTEYTETGVTGSCRSVAGENQLQLNSGQPGSLDDNVRIPAEISYSNTFEDEELKGTQAIPAVGDPENKKSRLPPEGDRAKLLSDRVAQHDTDQSNLDSFQDIGKSSEGNKNIQAGDQIPSIGFGSILQQPELIIQQEVEEEEEEEQQQQLVPSNIAQTQSKTSHQPDETSKKESDIVTNYRAHLHSYHKLHADVSSSTGTLDEPMSSLAMDDTDTDEPDSIGSEGKKETND